MVGADLVAGTLATNTGPNGHGFGDFLNNQAVDANHIVAAYGGNNGAVSVSTALTAHPGGRYDYDSETFVAHTLRGEGFDASEDGTGRGTPLVPWGVRQTAPTLTTTYGKQPDSSDTNAGPMLVPMRNPVPFDTTQITSASNYSNPKAGDPCHPLAAGAHAPAVAFGWQNAAAQGMAVDTISPTLDKSKHPAALTFQERGREGGRRLEIGGDVAYAMTAPSGGGRAQERNVMQGAAVRRLMPSECEALQGFPQGYTAIPWRGKPASECPDGPRYKALGNSWAVNCARWIGRRIGLVEQINLERAA